MDTVAGESDRTNNCSTAVQVTVQETLRLEQETESPEQDNPDLTFQAVVIGSGPSEEGYFVRFVIIIANVGKEASAASTLRYFRSTDATITNSGHCSGYSRGAGACRCGDQPPYTGCECAVEPRNILLRGVR